MALLDNNLTGAIPIVEDVNGLTPTKDNFTTLYDYAMVHQPDLLPELVYANGSGSIQELLDMTTKGADRSYKDDMIQWAEMGRLHNVLKGVTINGNNFTCTKKHTLQVNDVIKISNGSEETQATVTSITSDTVFVATNDRGNGFDNFTGPVTVLADFSNRYGKGTDAPTRGKVWDPKFKQNYSHIVKSFFDLPESDITRTTWIQLPNGEKRWFNSNLERNALLHDNKIELTNIFHERVLPTSDTALAGGELGMKGLIQQVEEGGNIANDYITDLAYLSSIAKRAKIVGACREFTFWVDHDQMAKFREMLAGVNASFVNGGHYGAFNNSKDMALKLDFASVTLDGVTFHFKCWGLLDDPTLMGATDFNTSSLAYLGIPMGQKVEIQINGVTHTKPYFEMLYRRDGMVDRKRKVKFFGCFGVEQSVDRASMEIITENTNRAVAVGNYFVGRRDSSFYA